MKIVKKIVTEQSRIIDLDTKSLEIGLSKSGQISAITKFFDLFLASEKIAKSRFLCNIDLFTLLSLLGQN